MNKSIILGLGISLISIPLLGSGYWITWENNFFTKCASPPLNTVHDPERLDVLINCDEAFGVITDKNRDSDTGTKTGDGDLRYIIRLPVVWNETMPTVFKEKNRCKNEYPVICVQLEVTPEYQRFPKNMMVREADYGNIVTVKGTLVIDTVHDWLEMTPVTYLKVNLH